MQLNYYQYVKKYFPVSPLRSIKESNTSLLISKQGYIIKEKKFSAMEWQLWKEHFKQEINLQNILNEQAPYAFLKILDWAEEIQKDMHQVFIIYENTSDSQNLEQYLKNNTISQEKLINIIFQLLRIGMELQSRKIFHLNLTFKNLIYINGIIKLTDFGSARVLHNYYFSKTISDEQKYQFHFYQSSSVLKIKMMVNEEDQDLQFQDIVSNELLQNQILKQNDEWAISLMICQIITQQLDIKIKKYEDYFCFNYFRIKEMLKQVKNSFPQLYILGSKLLEQKQGLKAAYNALVEITSQSKTPISKVKPLIIKLDPINSLEQQSESQFIAVNENYYYVSKENIKRKQSCAARCQQDSNEPPTTAQNDSKKITDDDKDDKKQFLHLSENSNDNQFTIFIREPSIQNMLNDNQLKELQQKEKVSYLKILQDLQSISKLKESYQKKILSQINSIEQSFIKQVQEKDLFQNNQQQSVQLITFIQLFWNQNFEQNFIIKQIFNQTSILNEYGLKYCESQQILFQYQSEKLSISDQNSIYIGYQKNNIPHGIGIKYIKQKKWKLIFGIFDNGITLQCIMFEQISQNCVQIFQGVINEKQIKDGECILEWFKIENNKFIKFQKHVGSIKENQIVGYGERVYCQSLSSQIQFNYIYKGNGRLYKERDGNLELIFDGEFFQDQYSGQGVGYFNKDLVIQATFSKGKIIQCQDLKYKQKCVTVF